MRGACCFPCPQVGGPAAAGPRFFILCGHGQVRRLRRVEGRRRRPRYGHPSVARARTWVARLAVARSAVRIRSKSPERQRRVVTNERSEIRNEGCRLCRPTVPQSGTVVTPSYALCHFGAGFSTFRAETHFSRGFHSFPMAHLSLFRWAIGGPRGPYLSLSYGAQCPLWPTAIAARVTPGPRRFCRRGGGPSVAQWAARGPRV